METKPLFVAARYKYLLILPFLLIIPVAIALSLLNRTTEYVSTSTVWVSNSSFVPNDVSGCSPYVTLAQCQANLLNEYMGTDAFAGNVASRAGLPVASDIERGNSIWIVRNGTAVFAGGTHPITILHRSNDPLLAQAIVGAVVDEFAAEYQKNTQADAERAEAIYATKLQNDEQALDEARAALASYTPRVSSGVDTELLALQADLDRAQSRYESTSATLEQIRQSAKAVLEGRDDAFRVVDPAMLPTSPVGTNIKQLAAMPIAGMLLAVSLAAGLYAFLLKTDRSVRVAEDLQRIPNLVLLGTVPDLSFARKRNWPKNFFRLAVTAMGTPREN